MFTCDFCRFMCQSYTWLLKHLETHDISNVSKVQCGYSTCFTTFASIKSLRRHLRKKHPEFYKGHAEMNQHADANIQELDHEMLDESQESHQEQEGIDHDVDYHSTQASQRKKIGQILLELREDYNLTSKSVSAFANKMCDVLSMCVTEISGKVRSFLQETRIQELEGLLEMLQEEPDTIKCCKSLNSQYKLEKFCKDELKYVAPVEYVLGRNDEGKPETLQHVPLAETLEWFLGFSDIYEDVLQNHESVNHSMHDVFDGSHYKSHEFLCEPKTLGIIIYFDEFTLTNPLRAHSKHQKIMATYFQLANMPASKRSQLDSIHLATLVKSGYVKKYGLKETTQYLINDLHNLNENGINIQHGGIVHNFKCALLFCVGDNLAAHQIGGFLESFSANRACRFCLVTKAELQAGGVGTKRSPYSHNQHVETVTKHPVLSSVYGVKGPSIFADIANFHCTTGLPSDIGHDLFEGVVKDITSNVVKHCIESGFTSVQDINDQISSFPYQGADKTDKPHNIQTNCEVKQTFCKMWCLFRLLPFLLGHLVPEDDAVWCLYLKLRTIVEYVCAKTITPVQVETLREVIVDFNRQRSEIWPEKRLKPKDHYLLHYPDQILKYGPLAHTWTIRFEAKHQQLGEIWKPSRCSKNIVKSLARRHQCARAISSDGRLTFFSEESAIMKAKMVKMKELPARVRALVNEAVTDDLESEISHGTGLKIGSTMYSRGTVVVQSSSNEPSFAEPRHAIGFQGAKYLICQKLATTGYSRHYHCYLVERTLELFLLREEELSRESCLGVYTLPGSLQLGIALKYMIN